MLMAPCALSAQEVTGRVTDATGAVVSTARVIAHNVDTNIDIPAHTNNDGNYTIPYLKPGNYTVSVQANGFDTAVRSGLNLQVGHAAVINFALKVGKVNEVVTVVGDDLLDREKADMGEVVENSRVTELPLNGRDPGMLSTLNAGVIWTGSISYQRPFDDTMKNVNINGGGSSFNEVMLDGVSNEAASTNNTSNSKIAYVPPADAVQEFKIVTNPYDAVYGRLAGGAVDMNLKSGTNKLHGSVYEYARRTFLDANTWINDYLGAQESNKGNSTYATAKMKWDQYGAELDGPVFLPHFYNGHDKTFFLLQFENFHEVVPDTIVTSVPDPTWVTGDFSNLTWYNGSDSAYEKVTLYDPTTFESTNNTRTAFDGNIIPSGYLNSMAKKIMALYPSPNLTPANGTSKFAYNYSTVNPTTEQYRNVLAKLDHNFSPKDRATLRYGYWERYEMGSTNGMPNPIAEGNLPHGERANTFAMEATHVFSSNLIFNFRAVAAVRADFSFNGPDYNPTNLGWSSDTISAMGSDVGTHFPYFRLSEFAYIGTQGNTQTVSNSLSMLPSATWVKGHHTIHAGADVRFLQSANDMVSNGPNFWVDRQWSQKNYNNWDNASGNSFASLLLGNASSGSLAMNTKVFWSQHYWAPFIQDDWKITHRLTLNLGVRWDLNPAAVERGNNGDYAFDTTTTNPVDALVDHTLLPDQITLKGGVTFLGVDGNPSHTYKTLYTNIQPRFGFAYSLDSKTVLRGGFGETFRNPQNGPNTLGYSSTTDYVGSLDDGKHMYTTNSIDHPFASGVSKPSGNTKGLLTDLGQGPWYLNPNYIVPSFWSYSFGVEREFAKHDTINISYVGSRAYNVDCTSTSNCNDTNPVSATEQEKCNPDDGGNPSNCDNNYVTNPFKGISYFEGSSDYTASTVKYLNLTRPFPHFNSVIEWQTNSIHTWYNSLQVTGMHKQGRDLTLHGTWTWSKSMKAGGWVDNVYKVPMRAIDTNDRTHRITLSGVYTLPVGHGRAFLNHTNRYVDSVIGGWEVGSMFIYETGWPWVAPGKYLHNAKVERHTETSTGYIRGVAACAKEWEWTDDGAGWGWHDETLSYNYSGTCQQTNFQATQSYANQTNNVYSGIRVPSNFQFDANLMKNFALPGKMNLQLRLEAFNAFNHPLWQKDYSTNFQDTSFGTIQKSSWGQSNLPREVQIAAKITW